MLDRLASLGGAPAYLIVAALAALEASAFVGLFVPGELALLIGGYIAEQGHARLPLMMAAAALAGIVGDSVGYEIGRRFGPRLRSSRLGRKVGDERWDRAERYVHEKGGRAVFAGRFIGVLRALVPAVAGAVEMPYRRFLLWNAAGAAIWAPGMVLAGYLAGSSYQRIEHVAGRAGLLLLVVAVVIGLVVAAARWIAHHPDRMRAFARRQLGRPRVASVIGRYQRQLAFLGRRFQPGRAFGLALTVQLALLAAGGWAFGAVLQDVLGGDDSTAFDRPGVTYFADHRTAWLTHVFQGAGWLGSTVVLVPVAAIFSVVGWRRTGTTDVARRLALALLGAVATYDVLKPLVGRPRPHVEPIVATASGYSFPSGHATQLTAVGVTLVVLGVARRRWSVQVGAWTALGLVIAIVSLSRVYLGVQWPTDVLAGVALGAAWATVVHLAFRVLAGRVRGTRRRAAPLGR